MDGSANPSLPTSKNDASYMYQDPITKKVLEYPEGLKEIPKEISLSKLPWVSPGPFEKEKPHMVRPEPDKDDAIALKEDFSTHTPSVEVLKRRAKYRPHLWFNFIPRDQRFMILTTYGPESEGYDINSPKIGFEFFGCFETLEQVAEQIQCIRHYNTHAVFLNFHVVEVGNGKRVQLPPPNDGSTKTTHLNKMHHQIMSKYLNKQVQNAEMVENRVQDSIDQVNKQKELVKGYNQKMEEYAKTILGLDKDQIKKKREDAKKNLEQKLPLMDQEKAKVAYLANPTGDSVEKQTQLANLKSLTYDQVEDFIGNQQDLLNLPKNIRVVYTRYVKDGKDYLVRSLQVLE